MAEAQEARVRGVFQQPPHEIGHAGEQIADRRVEPHAMAEVAQQFALRLGHAVEHLQFERARWQAEVFRVGQRDAECAQIVRAEGGVKCGAMIEQPAGELLVIRVGVALSA